MNKTEVIKELENRIGFDTDNERYALSEYEKDFYKSALGLITNTQEPTTEAHWIKEETPHGWDGNSYQCSKCGRSIHIDPMIEDITIDYPYCHCGAKMNNTSIEDEKQRKCKECFWNQFRDAQHPVGNPCDSCKDGSNFSSKEQDS